MRHRLNTILFVTGLCAAGAVCSLPAAAQEGPRDLRCENTAAPRDVKVGTPQLSWSAPGVQEAYQVLVASSEEKLRAGEGDLWDSGRILSSQKSARYRGKPLTSFEHCYWKVRVWGVYHQDTRYSEPAQWQMGILRFDDRAPK